MHASQEEDEDEEDEKLDLVLGELVKIMNMLDKGYGQARAEMKVTINLQLNLCLQRVTNDLEDGIHFTVHLLHQIKVEANERSTYRRDVESSPEDFNQERILPCSMTSGSAGCSRPTLCIVPFYERINEELCLHCRSIFFS